METHAGLRMVLPSRRTWAGVIAGLLIAAALAGSVTIVNSFGLRTGPNEFDIGAWEIRHVPQKWLFWAGELIRGEPSMESQEAHLRRFLQLSRDIRSAESSISDLELRAENVPLDQRERLVALMQERDSIENQVEATLEARISAVAGDLGLTRTFLDIVWPPVDIEFTNAPRALATSPRDRIELIGSDLLRADLSLAELEEIEREVETTEGVSALAFRIRGVGAYPAVIDYPVDYLRALRIAAHEWTHHYLFFRPLGLRYNASNDMRTINETVADLVGDELADAVIRRWPLVEVSAAASLPPSGATPTLDLGTELRALRGEVDALLAAGDIEAAEALMEAKRRELVDAGYSFRRLNQAYFAFTNLYAGEAGSPAAVNPIGPKVDQLRRQSASLSEFLDLVSGVTSVSGLDRLLAETAP